MQAVAAAPTSFNMMAEPQQEDAPNTTASSKHDEPHTQPEATSDSIENELSCIVPLNSTWVSQPYADTHQTETCLMVQGPPSPLRGDSPSSESSLFFCRICHEGEGSGGEKLLAPCRCSGTGGLVHQSCIEHWLGVANSSHCEICGFKYVVKRRPRPISQWVCKHSGRTEQRNLAADGACFLILTPLAGVSMWLCLTGAEHFNATATELQWETIGLVSLSIFLFLIYVIWCMVAIRYHHRTFRDWQKHNYIVCVVAFDKETTKSLNETFMDLNNNNAESAYDPTPGQHHCYVSPDGPLNSTQHEDGTPAVTYVQELDVNLSSVCDSPSCTAQSAQLSDTPDSSLNHIVETAL